jgi:hypothetical protein
MRELVRLWALLAVTYLTATEVLSLLWTEAVDVSAQVAINTLTVPAVQLAALAGFAKLRGADVRRFGDALGLGGFFIAWAVALVALGTTTLATGLLFFRTIDVTATMVSMLLFVPAAQAAPFCAATATQRWPWPEWRSVLTHPLAAPVLWIDALLLPAGWLLPAHPLVGLAEAAVLQRRWMGTKCLAAAVVLGALAFRSHKAPGRVVLIAAALVMAAIGLDGFTHWMFASAMKMPDPIAIQPLPIIWLEVFGTLAGLFAWASLRLIRLTEQLAVNSAFMLRAATVLMFLAVLSLLMNGFLSWVPVHPWAGMAMTFGSLAATAFAVASLMLAAPHRQVAAATRI